MTAPDCRLGLWMFPSNTAPVMADTIVQAEAAGLDEIWIGDEGPARDPLVTLAAAAPSTRSIRLGVAVTNPYLRHPAVTASAFATLAELAPGRVVLGLGSGGGLALGPLGLERDEPLRRVTDAVRIARAVLRGEATEGYDPPPHATAAADVPIYIGARGEQLNRMASRLADGVFMGGVPLPMLGPTLGWARSQRPVDAALYPNVAFSAEEVEMIRPQLVYAFLDGPAETRSTVGLTTDDVAAAVRVLVEGDEAPARSVIDDRLLDALLVRGSPEDIGRQLATLARQHRATSIGAAYVGIDAREILEPLAQAGAAFRRELA